MYMKYRLDPTLPDKAPGYYETITAYLEKHTDIAQARFWNELDYGQKVSLACARVHAYTHTCIHVYMCMH